MAPAVNAVTAVASSAKSCDLSHLRVALVSTRSSGGGAGYKMYGPMALRCLCPRPYQLRAHPKGPPGSDVMDSLRSLLVVLGLICCTANALASSQLFPDFNAQSIDWGHPEHGLAKTYLCTETNWSGLCELVIHPMDSCNSLRWPFRRRVGSFAPAPCTLCFAYETQHCSFGRGFIWMFEFPGNSTGGVGVPNNAWHDRMESFKCWRSPDCQPSGQ
ncbi:hypothetical protein C8Q80DRAFT_1180110 [Daedaleopsis nitida]|nr:hypothetical protein C8Q80DRAFT_1180110 [Daedaleopsis nitida]